MERVVCRVCGMTDMPKKVTEGSILIEIVLWMFFFIPGFIYSIWRLTTRHDACRSCGNRAIVPADSPMGRKLLKEMNEH